MFICCCQSFLVAAVGLWFVGLLLAVHGVAAGVVDVVVQCADECRPRGAEEMNGSVHVHCCFINCLYLIQYIGLTHHKRRPPSTSFGMSRRILSCGKGNRKGGRLEIVLLCEIFLNEFRFGSIALEHAAEGLVAVVVLGIAALGLLKRLFHLLKPVPSACAHTHGDGAGCTFYYCSHNRRYLVRYGCKDSANRAKYQRKTCFSLYLLYLASRTATVGSEMQPIFERSSKIQQIPESSKLSLR